MAEKIKDADDKLLEALFQAESIADDGFSDRVIGRLRRRLWLRRLCLPIAAVIGGSVAIKPLSALVAWATELLSALPNEAVFASTSWLPSPTVMVLGGIVFAFLVVGLRLLED